MRIWRDCSFVLLGGIVLLPLFWMDAATHPFTFWRAIGFRFLVELGLAGWLCMYLSNNTAILTRRPKIELPVLWGFIGLLVTTLTSDLLNPQYLELDLLGDSARMGGFVQLVHLFLYFLFLLLVLEEEKHWNTLFIGMLAVSNAVAFVTFWQFYVANLTAPFSTIGQTSILAQYLVWNVFLGFWLFARTKAWAVLLFVPLNLWAILLTGSRIAPVSLLVGAFVTTFALSRNTGLALLFFLLVSGWGAINIPELHALPLIQRYLQLQSTGLGTDLRFQLWPKLWHPFLQKPLFGWGQEGFRVAFAEYRLFVNPAWFDRAHNLFLDWLIGGGVFGLAAYVFLLWKGVAAGVQKSKSALEHAAILGMLLAYFVGVLTSFDMLVTYLPLVTLLAYFSSPKTS